VPPGDRQYPSTAANQRAGQVGWLTKPTASRHCRCPWAKRFALASALVFWLLSFNRLESGQGGPPLRRRFAGPLRLKDRDPDLWGRLLSISSHASARPTSTPEENAVSSPPDAVVHRSAWRVTGTCPSLLHIKVGRNRRRPSDGRSIDGWPVRAEAHHQRISLDGARKLAFAAPARARATPGLIW